MLKIIAERLRQKFRTAPYPAKEPTLPPRFKGRPILHDAPPDIIKRAMDVCPTSALGCEGARPQLDMGLCLFCGECERVAPDLIHFTDKHRLAALCREELIIRPDNAEEKFAAVTPDDIRKLFKRSFRIREVSAAGCNACEADCNVLTTLVYDLARFGIDFVASPRHADALLVTGGVPRNMLFALQQTYEAMPGPKVVIAVGACAISGGLFRAMEQEALGVSPRLPVDLFIPGCPPNPYTILDGLLRFLHREKG
ncbi:hydrogenase [Deltaproteobacteria bacterium]|nr:hydrogenase [Deltaproteobacteria bacterium]